MTFEELKRRARTYGEAESVVALDRELLAFARSEQPLTAAMIHAIHDSYMAGLNAGRKRKGRPPYKNAGRKQNISKLQRIREAGQDNLAQRAMRVSSRLKTKSPHEDFIAVCRAYLKDNWIEDAIRSCNRMEDEE